MNFTLSGEGVPGTPGASIERQQWSCHCAAHRPDPVNRPRRKVLEMELVEDMYNPVKRVPGAEEEDGTGEDEPKSTISQGEDEGFAPTQDDLLKSMTSLAQPLRALMRFKNRVARGGTKRTTEEMDIVGLLSQINGQLARTDDLETFLQSSYTSLRLRFERAAS